MSYQLSQEAVDDIKLRIWNGVPVLEVVQAAIAKELELGHLHRDADVVALLDAATKPAPAPVFYDAKSNTAMVTPPAVPPQKPKK